jgi:hypothetical protein
MDKSTPSRNTSLGAWVVGTWVLAALALTACHREAQQTPSAADPLAAGPSMGIYRAVLRLPAGELTEGTVAGPHLGIRMPGYENRLRADAKGDRLAGEVVLSKSGAKEQHIPFSAQLGQDYRFFDKPAGDTADVSGRWAVKFTDDDGKPEAAVGEFTQSQDVVSGTFLDQLLAES